MEPIQMSDWVFGLLLINEAHEGFLSPTEHRHKMP